MCNITTEMKKQCINHSKYVYSGKEASPLGLGIAAEPITIGTIQEGRDKTNWIVTIKNGVKVWSRITRLSEIRDHEKEAAGKENTIDVTISTQKKSTTGRKKTTSSATTISKDTNILQEANPSQNVEEKNVDISKQTSATKEPVKRKPTNYNIYMKYKLKQLVKEETNLKPKERIAHAVAIWQSMTPDEKNQIVIEAKEALEKGEI